MTRRTDHASSQFEARHARAELKVGMCLRHEPWPYHSLFWRVSISVTSVAKSGSHTATDQDLRCPFLKLKHLATKPQNGSTRFHP